MKNFKIAFAILFSAVLMVACDKPNVDPDGPDYDIPTTYNFENVSYSGQTTRLNQLALMSTYMKTSREGEKVTKEELVKIFENTPGNLGGSDAKMENKIFQLDKDKFYGYFEELESISGLLEPGGEGKAGVDGGNLFNENGVEIEQLIEKGLMGAVFYYQATSVYLGDDKMNVDNIEVTPGKGTAMEHHFDEAFGYFGAPKDPAEKDKAVFHAKYSNAREELLGTTTNLYNAFLKGRAAISNKDLEARDEAIAEIKANWELVIASTAISYINKGLKAETRPTRNHSLSEAIAFVSSLKYNIDKKIKDDELTAVLGHIGENLDKVDGPSLKAAKDILSTAYNLDSYKDSL